MASSTGNELHPCVVNWCSERTQSHDMRTTSDRYYMNSMAVSDKKRNIRNMREEQVNEKPETL
jgi:hypothetical protein